MRIIKQDSIWLVNKGHVITDIKNRLDNNPSLAYEVVLLNQMKHLDEDTYKFYIRKR